MYSLILNGQVIVLIIIKISNQCCAQNYFHNSNDHRLLNDAEQSNSYYNRLPINNYYLQNRNSKFLGSDNISNENMNFENRKLGQKRRKKFRKHKKHHQNDQQSNLCYYRNFAPSPAPQGRFFWDLNIYNVYPNGGQFSNNNRPGQQHLSPGYSQPILFPFNFGGQLSSFYNCMNKPYGNGNGNSGGHFTSPIFNYLMNLLNNNNNNNNNGDTDEDDNNETDNIGPDEVDDNNDKPVFESQQDTSQYTGPSLTPGQIVGGVANTVNGVIQTLSGNGKQGAFLMNLYNRIF